MNISELSIRRPVLATVLTVIILLFGLIGYTTLGVREYPSVDNPIISVSCSYPGANAEVIENQITEPLEQNINGIPGIRSLSSVSQQGQSRITVEFELSVDLETAANDVVSLDEITNIVERILDLLRGYRPPHPVRLLVALFRYGALYAQILRLHRLEVAMAAERLRQNPHIEYAGDRKPICLAHEGGIGLAVEPHLPHRR